MNSTLEVASDPPETATANHQTFVPPFIWTLMLPPEGEEVGAEVGVEVGEEVGLVVGAEVGAPEDDPEEDDPEDPER
jgi:hypothetical protein